MARPFTLPSGLIRSVLPAVRADMKERFVVNLRVPVAAMAEQLPARLRPQDVDGWAIASFCALNLENITVAPLPTIAGWRSLSAAERWGVLDEAGPAVYVLERLTSSRLGSVFTQLGFSAPHGHLGLRVSQDADGATVEARTSSETLLRAQLRHTESLGGSVFADVEAFAAFLAAGVRSYGTSRHPGRLTVLDLHKTDASYDPMRVEAAWGSFVDRWRALGGELDSAFRTVNADYEWTYHGLVDESPSPCRTH